MRLLLSLLPLIAFYAAETWLGTRWAIVVAIALAAVEVVVTRQLEGRWNRMAVGSAGLVGLLGGLSLLSDDERFMLWSPAVGDVVFAAILAGLLWRGTNIIRVAAEEQDPELDLHPLQIRFLDGMAWRFAANLLLHAALVAWSVDQSRETWLFVSGPLQIGMFAVQTVGEALWSRWVVWPAVDADDALHAEAHPPQRGPSDPAS